MMTQRGFTLFELVLVIAILGVLVSFSGDILYRLSNRSYTDAASSSFRASIHRAQSLARSGYFDGAWGVYATSGAIIVFQGLEYSTRNLAHDEITSIAPTIAFGGTQEFVFDQFTGMPNTSGSMTLAGPDGPVRTFTITPEGRVQ